MMGPVFSARGLFIVGVALSGIAIYYAMADLDWEALVLVLKRADIVWLAISCLFVALGILLRGLRWWVLAGLKTVTPFKYARAVNLGVLANQVLPGRIGEIVRIFALIRLLPTGISIAFGSALLDRTVDVAVLILSASFIAASLTQSIVPKAWLIYVSILFVILILTFNFVRSKGFFRLLSVVSASRLGRWAIQIDTFVPIFDAMWRNLLHPLVSTQLFFISITLLAVDYLTVSSVITCVGLTLPIEAPLLLWIALAASSALPSAPGYVGIYQLAAIWSLGSYDVAAYQAIAVAFVLQGIILVVSIIGSVPYLFQRLHLIRKADN